MKRFSPVAVIFSLSFLAACATTPPIQPKEAPVPGADAVAEPVNPVPATEESTGGDEMEEENAEESSVVDDGGGDEEALVSRPRIIDVTAENWAFTPSVITVKKGEAVQLRIRGVSGVHGYTVPGLGIEETIAPHQIVTVDLPTEKPGTYSLFCSVPCGVGHTDMTGMIVIEE